jgi:hypothetical protein
VASQASSRQELTSPLTIVVRHTNSYTFAQILAPKFAGELLLQCRRRWLQVSESSPLTKLLNAIDGRYLSAEDREVIHVQIPRNSADSQTLQVVLDGAIQQILPSDSKKLVAIDLHRDDLGEGTSTAAGTALSSTPTTAAHQEILRQVFDIAVLAKLLPVTGIGVGMPDLICLNLPQTIGFLFEIKSSASEDSTNQARTAVGQVSGYLGRARMRYPEVQWHAVVVVDSQLEFEFENAALAESLIFITKTESLASYLAETLKGN